MRLPLSFRLRKRIQLRSLNFLGRQLSDHGLERLFVVQRHEERPLVQVFVSDYGAGARFVHWGVGDDCPCTVLRDEVLVGRDLFQLPHDSLVLFVDAQDL